MNMSWYLNIALTLPADEALIRHQKNVIELVFELESELRYIYHLGGYTPQQQIELNTMAEKVMLEVLGENPCFYNQTLYNIYTRIVLQYSKLKQYDDELTNYMDEMCHWDRYYENDERFQALREKATVKKKG